VATLEGHSGSVNSVAFHPTVQLLATGSGDSSAKLWRFSPDGSTATCVATLAGGVYGHGNSVTSVAFHPSAWFLATGGDDSTVKLWKIKKILEELLPIVVTVSPARPASSKPSSASSAPSDSNPLQPKGGSIIRHHKKRSSRKLKRYASKRIKRNRNRNKYRKSKKAKTKRYRKLR
jgi:WD40 repeat protein